jgi:hypothetical protein
MEIESASLHNSLGVVVFQDFNTFELILQKAVVITDIQK